MDTCSHGRIEGKGQKALGTQKSSMNGIVAVIVVNCTPQDGMSIWHICTHEVKTLTFKVGLYAAPKLE